MTIVTGLKEEIDNLVIIVGNLNNPLLIMD